MAITCDEYNQVCVIAVEGDLSNETCAQLRRGAVEHLDQRRLIHFVIDLAKSPFIDSEGLETLLWLKGRCEDSFGHVKLVNLDDNCRKILEITRLDHRFEAHGNLAEALKTMRS